MANLLYNNMLNSLMVGEHDFSASTLKLALLSDSYTPNAFHSFTEIMSNEISGAGYTAGGKTLANVTLTNGEINGEHVQWTGAVFSTRWAFLYIEPNIPVIIFDLGINRTVNNDIFRIIWEANPGTSGMIMRVQQKLI